MMTSYLHNFKIRKNFHRAVIRWTPFIADTLVFTTEFTEDMWYFPTYEHINKLFGFSDGGMNHHNNSIRIGWKPTRNENEFTVFAYAYIDGERYIETLDTVKVGKNSFTIQTFDTHYLIEVYDGKEITKPVIVERGERSVEWYKHLLFPYFGGKPTAPRAMTIPIMWDFYITAQN